ncbi:MAG: DUF393 domain-containing protein [Beijerinckiaceae bacterium]|nr:DUF393 domain-containing protein [Beijerinckiaceae bacterium]
MAAEKDELTVYFDGSCPLCRAEISHYARQTGADSLCFVDVSKADAPMPDGLDREAAMARFHVRDKEGRLVSGAPAFVRIWRALPRWGWAARIASAPGVTPVLELGYRMFLPVRPFISRAMARLSRKDAGAR